MKKINYIIVMMIGILLIGTSCTNTEKKSMTAKQIPLEDFFKNPEKNSYQISPDGKYYSYMAPYENRMNIFVQERGSDEVIQLTAETDRSVSGYFWPNSERILYLKDTGGDENFKLYGINVDSTNPIAYTEIEGVRTQIIDDLPDLPNEVIIGLNERNPQVFDPYRLNLVTGKREMIAENPGNIQGWMFDHNGKLRVAFAIVDGINVSILYRETEADEWKTVLTTSFKDNISPEFFTFDNKNVIATSNLGRDKSAVVEFDIANGKEVKVLYENPDYDVSSVSYSKKRKVITSANYTSSKREKHFFDQQTKDLYKRLEKELGNYEIAITGINKMKMLLL